MDKYDLLLKLEHVSYGLRLIMDIAPHGGILFYFKDDKTNKQSKTYMFTPITMISVDLENELEKIASDFKKELRRND